MNIFGNVRLFAIIGVVVVAILVVTALLTAEPEREQRPAADSHADQHPDPNATPTATPDASASPTEGPKQFTAPEDVVDAATQDYEAVIKTSKGTFTIALDAENAPNTVNSFVFLAQQDYFDGTTFHRVVENFVIQGGDPTGPAPAARATPCRTSRTRFPTPGTRSRWRRHRGASSFGSQFFINLKDNTTLDYNNPSDKFYPFGEVTTGWTWSTRLAPRDLHRKRARQRKRSRSLMW